MSVLSSLLFLLDTNKKKTQWNHFFVPIRFRFFSSYAEESSCPYDLPPKKATKCTLEKLIGTKELNRLNGPNISHFQVPFVIPKCGFPSYHWQLLNVLWVLVVLGCKRKTTASCKTVNVSADLKCIRMCMFVCVMYTCVYMCYDDHLLLTQSHRIFKYLLNEEQTIRQAVFQLPSNQKFWVV